MNITFNATGHGTAYMDTLKAICGNTEDRSLIDLGCGWCTHTRQLKFKEKRLVDIVVRDLGEENNCFVQVDMLELIKQPSDKIFDISISSDNIEHFWQEDGFKIIDWMENNSKKQIIFTPLGDYIKTEDKTDTNPDSHKSGCLPKDFELIGWNTITFPQFHPTLGEHGLGAFFAFHCENLNEEFNRIINELKNKSWIK